MTAHRIAAPPRRPRTARALGRCLILVLALLAGCTTVLTRNPVPAADLDLARPYGIAAPLIRFWGDRIDTRTMALIQAEQVGGSGGGDLYRIWAIAQRDGIALQVMAVPPALDREATEPFDRDYMAALYGLGREIGRTGRGWIGHPPGFDPGLAAATALAPCGCDAAPAAVTDRAFRPLASRHDGDPARRQR